MLTRCFETAGSLGNTSFKGRQEPPMNNVFNDVQELARAEKLMKHLKKIDEIQNKPSAERTLEEKIELANHYGKVFLAKVADINKVCYVA